MPLFYSELLLVKNKTQTLITNLKEEVKLLKVENKSIMLTSKNKKLEYQIFYESILKNFETVDSDFNIDIINNQYKNILALQGSLNKIINFINISSSA